MQPTLRLRPRRPAVAYDASSNLDLLLTIAALATLVTIGAKRWRAQGLDLDGERGIEDGN